MSKTTVLQEKTHVLVKVTPETIVEALDHYQQMAKDEYRELEALEWAEATIGDVADETR